MFGRKKKIEEEKKMEELEKIKSQVTQSIQQPMIEPSIPLGIPELKTPYFIGEKIRIERPKRIITGTGQVIDTPEKEIVETINIIHELSVKDLIDMSKGIGEISKRAINLIEKGFQK